MKQSSSMLIMVVIIIAFISGGCSTSQEVNVPQSNMRKQMAIQRHLLKLNRQNEKLQKTLKESSVVNIETGEVLENNFVTKENIPELNKILQEFKLINTKTQNALNSFEKSVKNDTAKNDEINAMLDGIAIECKQQKDRVDRAKELIDRNEGEWSNDNLHIGISTVYDIGNFKDLYKDTNYDYDFSYSGYSSSAYISFVSNAHISFGYRYSMSRGIMKSDELENATSSNPDPWTYSNHEMNLQVFSLGLRIYGVRTFNIVPQFEYGRGEAKIIHCFDSGCNDPDTNTTYAVDMYSFDLPFYHQLSSAFSWGFKLGYRQINYNDYNTYVDGNKTGSSDQESDAILEVASAGLMIGFAW